MYTFLWDGVWAEPVDILAGVQDTLATALQAYQNRLYLLWIAQGQLELSTSCISEAMSVSAWQTTNIPLLGETRYADLLIEDGIFYLSYVLTDGRVCFVVSSDLGQSFAPSVVVWNPPGGTINTRVARLAKGDGVLHIVWEMDAEELTWSSYGTGYARSIDGGKTWQDEWQVLDEGGNANVVVDGDGVVHVLWNRSAEGGSRVHRWSTDNGSSWTQPDYLWPGMFGRTGFPSLTTDSSGALHLVTSNDLDVGLYHVIWKRGQGWSQPEPMIATRQEWGEWSWAVISGGNRLDVVYMSFDNKDIWYMSEALDAPFVAPEVSTLDCQDSGDAFMIDHGALVTTEQGIEPVESVDMVLAERTQPVWSNSTSPIFISIGVCLLLLVVVFLSVRYRNAE